ncbi:MAG: tetratricopeptide repeat protein [Anaerolineaceae bacterium]|nr:tetratricopeptide repeat protein [Anaerolineaceae bacterium]
MRRIGVWFLLSVMFFALASASLAQESTATPSSSSSNEITVSNDVFQELLDRVETAEGRAFNLLGVYEAIGQAITVGSVLITVLGILGGAAGVSQVVSARRELTESSEQLKEEAAQLRKQFDEEIRMKEAQLDTLRKQLEEAAAEERQATSNALLANALIPLGERQYKTGDYTGAMNTYVRALELDQANPVVHQRLAYVYTQMGELKAAESHYQIAIDQENKFAPALAGLGFVYRRMAEKLDDSIERDRMMLKAEDMLLQALDISPRLIDDDGESWWGVLGGLYKRNGNIERAINAYERATEITPQSSYGMGNLALLYMRKKDSEKMIETYERVEHIAMKEADQEQGNFWGYADLVVSRFALGKIEEAEQALKIAVAIAPFDSPYMLSSLADTLRELTDVVGPDTMPPLNAAIASLEMEQKRRQNLPDMPEGDSDE